MEFLSKVLSTLVMSPQLAYIRYAPNLLCAMLCEVRLAILSWAVNSYDTMNLDLQRGLHQGKHLDAPRSS